MRIPLGQKPKYMWNLDAKTVFKDLLARLKDIGGCLGKMDNKLGEKNLKTTVKNAITNAMNRGPQGSIREDSWTGW